MIFGNGRGCGGRGGFASVMEILTGGRNWCQMRPTLLKRSSRPENEISKSVKRPSVSETKVTPQGHGNCEQNTELILTLLEKINKLEEKIKSQTILLEKIVQKPQKNEKETQTDGLRYSSYLETAKATPENDQNARNGNAIQSNKNPSSSGMGKMQEGSNMIKSKDNRQDGIPNVTIIHDSVLDRIQEKKLGEAYGLHVKKHRSETIQKCREKIISDTTSN